MSPSLRGFRRNEFVRFFALGQGELTPRNRLVREWYRCWRDFGGAAGEGEAVRVMHQAVGDGVPVTVPMLGISWH